MVDTKTLEKELLKGAYSATNNMEDEVKPWQKKILRKAKRLRKIAKPYMEMKPTELLDVFCPKCGDRDRGNRRNGRPWCFKCDWEMFTREKLEKWLNRKLKIPPREEIEETLKETTPKTVKEMLEQQKAFNFRTQGGR